MPKIPAERLEEIGRALFIAAGTPEEEAALVMRHIVGANLVGHDSHGVIQIPTYIERIKVGHIVPGAPWVIVKESPTTTVVDGHWGFGYVVNERAMRLTIEKAEKSNVAAATVFRQGHIGRLSSYTQIAAKTGMIGLWCGPRPGLGLGAEPTGGHNDGGFMACFKVDAFRPLADFKREVGEFTTYLKEPPPSEGSSGVLYPGEIEHRREQDRRQNGIDVEDSTWDKIKSLAQDYGLARQLAL